MEETLMERDIMFEPIPSVAIVFRIPGVWTGPEDFASRLPAGCRMSKEGLVLADGRVVEMHAVKADEQFASVFRASCRQPPKAEELAVVDRYAVNVVLEGPGGSLDAARHMMRAAAAIVRAGGAGVFIDNSALAHGGHFWLDLAGDGSPDALTFAFAAIVQGKSEIWTMGMHMLGLRDIVMNRSDVEQGGFDIVDVIRYVAASDKPVDDGHLIGDLDGPRFRATALASPPELSRGPMHNPFGRLKLVPMRDIAESN